MDRLRDILLLCLLGLLVYLPGIASLPVIDRDEARYAQSVVQMVETGDYVDIRFQEEPRYKKPVGAYWAQAAAIHLTGQADDVRAGARPIWAQRLPSVVGALLAVVFTYLAGVALLGRRAAVVGAAILAVSVSLVFEAHQAKTDALLAGCAAAVLWGLAVRNAWGVWIGIALGVLVKGPVIVGVAGLTLATLAVVERSGARLRELARPLPMLAALSIALPWFVAIGLKTDGAFFAEALGRDFGAKLGSAQETHGGWPGYYLLTTLVMFWPGVIALPLAGVWAWRERGRPEVALLLAWVVPMWLVLEVVPTKLPHYTLPLYPALALLCGGAVVALWDTARWMKWVGVGLALVIGCGLVVLGRELDPIVHELTEIFGSWFFGLLIVGGILIAWRRTVLGVGLAGVAASTWVLGIAGGESRMLGTSRMLVTNTDSGVDHAGLLNQRRLVSPDFREPSLVYLAGTDTLLSLEILEVGDVVALRLTDRALDASGAAALEIDSEQLDCLRPVGSAFGSNYAKGEARIGLQAFTTDGCGAAELETWRAREAARRRGSG